MSESGMHDRRYLTDRELAQQVNEAFKNCASVLALSRLQLAQSPLVEPTLVRDPVSPTAEERSHGLRLLLQWAVNRLAPAPATYPFGVERPFDDPTWRDPRWWRYSILRHRYLEPLHPDLFVEGGRFTETLMALTGIPSSDTFFDERNRAIREVAQWLSRQLRLGEASDEIQTLALEQVYSPLQQRPTELALLGIAATFQVVFPRALLLALAKNEAVKQPEQALNYLITQRLLLTGDQETTLLLSPVLRGYVYARQPARQRPIRHRRAARYFQDEHDPLRAAAHLQAAGDWDDAAALLLGAADGLINELQVDDLRASLLRLEPARLAPARRLAVLTLLADLHYNVGEHEAALAACRDAIQVAESGPAQARIYRRMGKLYEKHSPMRALAYYRQAEEHFPPDAPELVLLHKDRGWLQLQRQAWDDAKTDLTQALTGSPADSTIHADILDALASLHRAQGDLTAAVDYAQEALELRERLGNLAKVADSCNNLGLAYSAMGEYAQAIQAYQEALATYQKLGNRERIATAYLNIGLAHHLAQQPQPAMEMYEHALEICRMIGQPLVASKAHSNLVELLAELGRMDEARTHWLAGYALNRKAELEDELRYYRELRAAMPALQEIELPDQAPRVTLAPPMAPALLEDLLDPEEEIALQLAGEGGHVTARALMDAANVSKATATRKLSGLVERRHLAKHGRGRGTYYTLLRPAASAGAAVPAHRLDDRLQLLQRELADRYGIRRLAMLNRPERRDLVQVAVVFDHLPDLPAFVELQRRLRADLRLEVQLVPEMDLAAEDRPTLDGAHSRPTA